MPKLLFVGIVERTCSATIIREIPGITECFQVKDDSKKGGEPEIKVGSILGFPEIPLTLSVLCS